MQVGLSKVLSREATNVSIIGSFDYLAPEARAFLRALLKLLSINCLLVSKHGRVAGTHWAGL